MGRGLQLKRKIRSRSLRGACRIVGVLACLLSCEAEKAPAPLGPEEQALVQTYVRLTVLQALHARTPDSTAAVLGHLSSQVDTVAVRQALEALSRQPLRWELVYGAITARLEELEATPSVWWSVARGDTLLPLLPPQAPEPPPSARTPVPGR